MEIMVASFFRKVLDIAASDIDVCGNIQDIIIGNYLWNFNGLLPSFC